MTRSLFAVAVLVLGFAAYSVAPLAAAPPGGNPFGAAPVGHPKRFTDVGKMNVEVSPREAKPGQTVTVKLTVTPVGDAWTYPTNPADPTQPGKNRIRVPDHGDLIFVGAILDPTNSKTKPQPQPDRPGAVMQYYPFPVTWDLTAVVSPKASPGPKTVPLTGTSVQICGTWDDRELCFNSPKEPAPTAELMVLDGPPVPVDQKWAPDVEKALNPNAVAPPVPGPVRAGPPRDNVPSYAGKPENGTKKSPVSPAQYGASLDAVAKTIDLSEVGGVTKGKTGLLAFLVTAATWGLISLVTPCVFPMIPITVTIFLKQANQSRVQTIKLAAVYCLTIVLVLGVSAIALLKLFVDLSVSPGMNLFLGGLFIFFALSLFGMYDISLPNSLLRFTQAKQGAGGVVGTVFGALAFTIVSFTCVAPFLGGFAGMATSGGFSTFELTLGGLAFSAAFAAPFFLLALFPRLLKALPRSGGWLDSVKAVMGFLELAAALKFLRTAEIGVFSPTTYFTYDLVLGGWVAITIACGLYLLNMYRLPHDEEQPNIGVPRLVFALLFLGLGVYLAPALFKGADGKPQRPSGVVYAWVDSFLLPDPAVEFGTDLTAALEKARQEAAKTGKPARPVFIDFTGKWCTNCRYNENSVFPRPQVWALMEQYERVQLYADEVPPEVYANPPSPDDLYEEGQANRAFKDKLFGTDQLPLYVILLPGPDGTWKAKVYPEGKINDVGGFMKFLQDGLRTEKQ
ncbi:MAG: dsbD [Gemmataceae bacterium]|nr:dsbD [Gemmataceae bacterium]